MHIVDRRLNPGGKSLANRQRFLRRAKALVKRAVRDTTRDRSIRDVESGGEVSIPGEGVREPRFHRAAQGGMRDYVLPGNKDYVEGETIPRPPGSGGGGGSQGSPDGEGEDEFRFALSHEEFVDLFLEDLELPDLAKRKLATTEHVSWRRAGFSVTGSPANLALTRTMRNSLSRRIALRRPRPEAAAALEEEIAELERTGDDPARLIEARDDLARMRKRLKAIPWIDPIDLRYRRSEPYPRPVAQAAMFCLMDVSGSMTEHMKDLAKRFFTLLYLFLKRRYKHVEIVFIRHTHEASEVDEETFFYSRETGGTIVSTALAEMQRVVAERFPPEEWNIYAAQASDGDNTSSDNPRTADLLTGAILPACQYFAYLEVGREDDPLPMGFGFRQSDLWRLYDVLRQNGEQIAMRKVRHRRDIYPVFRELFQRKQGAEQGAGA
jgi:uncharacterized sporulation protein YeaH/YhbH (DUF444 family)